MDRDANGARARARLAALATGANSLSALSRMLGRNGAYLSQYIHRGSPRALPDRERRLLADHLGVDEAELGGPDPRFPVPRYAVAAAAGPEALVDAELMLGTETLDPLLARRLGLVEGQAAMLRTRGVSMEPTLADGDHLVIRLDDRRPDQRGGVYVIRGEDGLMVKRVRATRTGLAVTSDNPAAAAVTGAVEVIGRVVWRMGAPR